MDSNKNENHIFGFADVVEKQIQKMTVKEALELIVENCNCPALNYAVNYAKYALELESTGQLAELRIQLLYVVSNMGNWRTSKAFQVTTEEIKECRAVLKAACK